MIQKLFDTLVTGLAQGAMIALVALGYTRVFGVLKMINFAHSEVFVMDAYVGLFVIAAIGGQDNPIVAGVAGTLIAMAAESISIDTGPTNRPNWGQHPALLPYCVSPGFIVIASISV